MKSDSEKLIDKLRYCSGKEALFVICFYFCIPSSDKVGIQVKYLDLADLQPANLDGIIAVIKNEILKIDIKKLTIRFWIRWQLRE